MTRQATLAAICVFFCSSVLNVSAQEPSVEAFETQLDFTIRSACHGNMVDAIPDFLSEARIWLNETSPFCQTVRTLPEDTSAYALLKQQSPGTDYTQDPEYKVKYLSGYNEDLYRHSDCNDWMCEHIRNEAYNKGSPISLADYRKVEQHCDAHYGCIESWFKTWPRALPATQAASVGLTLDSLMATEPAAPDPAVEALPGSSRGLSLDDLLGSSQPPARQALADVSLDNVFAGREQLALEESLENIRSYNNRLTSDCSCSLGNSGCYQLPAESLLKAANQVEQNRYDLCGQWEQIKLQIPSSSGKATQMIQQLANLENSIEELDDEMESRVQGWEEERRRLIAQQQREASERSESAYIAGMASILVQATAVANGSLSAEQAAQNAVNVSNEVESGRSWGSAMGRNITSSIPTRTASSRTSSGSSASMSASNSGGQSFVVDENYSFTCASGISGSVPVKARSNACANAMKRYARVAGCNLYEEQEAAQNAYYSACASEMY